MNLHGTLYVRTCILNVWTCIFIVFCVFLVFGPIQKDAHRKTMHLGGTQTSRSFTRTRLVTKTMDGLNPPNVNPINSNYSCGSASPVCNQVFECAFLCNLWETMALLDDTQCVPANSRPCHCTGEALPKD